MKRFLSLLISGVVVGLCACIETLNQKPENPIAEKGLMVLLALYSILASWGSITVMLSDVEALPKVKAGGGLMTVLTGSLELLSKHKMIEAVIERTDKRIPGLTFTGAFAIDGVVDIYLGGKEFFDKHLDHAEKINAGKFVGFGIAELIEAASIYLAVIEKMPWMAAIAGISEGLKLLTSVTLGAPQMPTTIEKVDQQMEEHRKLIEQLTDKREQLVAAGQSERSNLIP